MSWSSSTIIRTALNRACSTIVSSKIHEGIFALVGVLFLLGCTEGSPSISTVQDLPPIQLDKYRYESRALQYFDIALTGRVVKIVNRLEVSLDNGASWVSLENGGASSLNINLATCSDACAFTYALNDVGVKWPALMNLQPGGEMRALVRGQSDYGVTTPAPFVIARTKSEYFSLGALGLNQLGGKAKTLNGGLVVIGGKLEARGKGGGVQ